MSGDFSHFDDTGNAHMVDVGDKAVTKREAVAEGRLLCAPETLALITSGGVKKASGRPFWLLSRTNRDEKQVP